MGSRSGNSIFKKNIYKIIIPLLIIFAIGAVWVIKNAETQSIAADKNGLEGGSLEEAAFALHVTDHLDINKLKSYGIPIMIDFGADSCVPCVEMAPVLEQLNKELRGRAIILFVDVWKYQDLLTGYPIRVIPTQLFIDKNGQPYNPSDPQNAQMNIYISKDTNEHLFTTHEGGMTKEMILNALKEMGLEE